VYLTAVLGYGLLHDYNIGTDVVRERLEMVEG
jgi:hypothetical protein